jgi:hypothetical protein
MEIIISKELFAYMKNNNPEAKEPNFQNWANKFLTGNKYKILIGCKIKIT